MSNLSQFRTGLASFSGEVFENHGQLLKRVARSVITDVIAGTPVDTGHARANWQVGVNEVPTDELMIVDPDGAATTLKCLSQLSKSRAGDIISVVNNVPYIDELENGHSGQAPNGIVAVAVERAKLIG